MRSNSSSDNWLLYVLFGGFGASILFQLIRQIPYLWHHRDTSHWTATKAITFRSSFASAGRNGGVIMIIAYSYRVTEYESGEYRKVFDSQGDADAFFASLEGDQMTVRFDPSHPSVSELDL